MTNEYAGKAFAVEGDPPEWADIEVTPEMIEAGRKQLPGFVWEDDIWAPDLAVTDIYKAMFAARPKG